MKADSLKFLVSGASGFIGESFISFLNRNGYISARFGRINGSVQQIVSLPKFNDTLIDEVTANLFQDKTNFVHLATKYEKPGFEVDPTGILEANINYSLLCLRLASYFKLHFTTVSSIQQFGGINGIYANSKNLFDSFVDYETRLGLQTSRLVIGDTFGENDTRPKLINYIMSQVLSGQAVELSHPQNSYAPIDIMDLTKRLFQCSQNLGTYKLIPQESIRLVSLVEMCEEIFERKINVTWSKFKVSSPEDWKNAPGDEIISKNNLLRLPGYIAAEWDKKLYIK